MIAKQFFVKLNGGLGNQMFQWAFARALEMKTDAKALLDMSYFEKKYARPYQLDIFKLEPMFVKNLWLKMKLSLIWRLRKLVKKSGLFGLNLYLEPHFQFDADSSNIDSNTYVTGFFQSELYFKDIEEKIRENFEFKNPPDDENKSVIEMINAQTAVSLHVRRGDYVQKKRYQNVYATCSLDYYKRAVEYIAAKNSDITLFIFSDDIEWVKENLKFNHKCVYVSHNTGDKSYEDMRLMSLCTHNVIANSSFSWWGAWLNKNKEKIVIAPQKWFNDDNIIQTDVIPETWIRIEN